MDTTVGVDGCRRGWFYFRKDGSNISHGVSASLADLIAFLPYGSRVCIDIPIGLPDAETAPTRLCDTAARKLLAPHRASSVFPAPARATLSAASYDDAKMLNQAVTGRKISRQTYAILAKIREVDELLSSNPVVREMLRETHPELCFWAMNNGQAMPHSKKTEPGFRARLQLLQSQLAQAPALITNALDTYLRKDVARDDIVDALACLLVAASAEGDLRTVPKHGAVDALGIRMEILYAEPASADT